MDLEWSPEQQELRALARDFAEREIAPHVGEYDKTERFPREIVEQAAALGFAGGIVPTEYGGAGLDHVTYAGLIEEISRACHIVACALTFPSGLVGNSILTYGTEEQKQRYLKPLAQGETFAGAGVTEARSGTDVSDMDTTARRDGSDWVINGAKMWISFLDVSSYYLTFAHLGQDEQSGRKRICAFIVDADLPGVSTHPLKNKYGFRPLSTGELVLENVRLPADALLGEEGQGFEIAMNSVENGRLGVAARAVGLSQACCDVAIEYAKERRVFKQPIGKFQLVQEMISDMVCGTEGARFLTLKLAHMKDKGERARGAASMAKMTASDVALKSATDAFQIHGAYGVSDEYPVARYLRDAKVFQIVEGNNQLHKALVAESVLGLR
jgi:alkylation response protein AidB-like acyl-CoA dehydrogenase